MPDEVQHTKETQDGGKAKQVASNKNPENVHKRAGRIYTILHTAFCNKKSKSANFSIHMNIFQ